MGVAGSGAGTEAGGAGVEGTGVGGNGSGVGKGTEKHTALDARKNVYV
jgi:hypothetical protein